MIHWSWLEFGEGTVRTTVRIDSWRYRPSWLDQHNRPVHQRIDPSTPTSQHMVERDFELTGKRNQTNERENGGMAEGVSDIDSGLIVLKSMTYFIAYIAVVQSQSIASTDSFAHQLQSPISICRVCILVCVSCFISDRSWRRHPLPQ